MTLSNHNSNYCEDMNLQQKRVASRWAKQIVLTCYTWKKGVGLGGECTLANIVPQGVGQLADLRLLICDAGQQQG